MFTRLGSTWTQQGAKLTGSGETGSAGFGNSVSLSADGNTALTAFIPNDQAFLNLASALSGKKVMTEAGAFKAVAGLGIDTVETVLLYHVVPGATIDSGAALKANGQEPLATLAFDIPNKAQTRTFVTLNCGANINFDRLRHVAERADIGAQREALFAVTMIATGLRPLREVFSDPISKWVFIFLGLLLAVCIVHSPTLDKALLPWIVATARRSNTFTTSPAARGAGMPAMSG